MERVFWAVVEAGMFSSLAAVAEASAAAVPLRVLKVPASLRPERV